MIKGRVIVCVGSAWDYDPTCKHQVMRLLARDNVIIWINYHGTRRPSATRADFGAVLSTLRRVARGAEPVSESMVQVTPLVIPGARRAATRAMHRRLLIAQIRRAIRSVRQAAGRPVQVWTFAPDVPFLVGQFGEECFVYYCTDEYREFACLDRATLAAGEDALLATSRRLWERKRRRRHDAALALHGVDYEHFAEAWRTPAPLPDDVADLSGPVFGFFGLIHHWIDVALIAEVARLRPAHNFVMIGDRRVDASALAALPNVRMLGRRSYAELPAYCRAFAAGLMPFAVNEMTRFVNPIKMYEYLAAGLPVISTPLPEAERFGGPVRIAAGAAAFAAACDRAAAEATTVDRAAISARVADRTWTNVAEEVSGIVEAGAARRRAHVRSASRAACGLDPQSAAVMAVPVAGALELDGRTAAVRAGKPPTAGAARRGD